MVEDRIPALEDRVARLERGPSRAVVDRAPVHLAAPRRRGRARLAPPPAGPLPRARRAPPSRPRARRRPRPARDLEDFVGGSLLAWLGGIAVLAGLAFLLTIAISSGWIGEGARTVLAGALSAGLLGAGVWLRERKRQTEASLAAAAVGIAGLFGTLVVAGPVYHLVPVPLAFAGAFATGAVATALAIHWRAQVMGWLGLLGALWAPTALGAFDGGGMVFLAIAFAATIPVARSPALDRLGVFAYVSTTVMIACSSSDAARGRAPVARADRRPPAPWRRRPRRSATDRRWRARKRPLAPRKRLRGRGGRRRSRWTARVRSTDARIGVPGSVAVSASACSRTGGCSALRPSAHSVGLMVIRQCALNPGSPSGRLRARSIHSTACAYRWRKKPVDDQGGTQVQQRRGGVLCGRPLQRRREVPGLGVEPGEVLLAAGP